MPDTIQEKTAFVLAGGGSFGDCDAPVQAAAGTPC
jgi:hypothetical protein